MWKHCTCASVWITHALHSHMWTHERAEELAGKVCYWPHAETPDIAQVNSDIFNSSDNTYTTLNTNNNNNNNNPFVFLFPSSWFLSAWLLGSKSSTSARGGDGGNHQSCSMEGWLNKRGALHPSEAWRRGRNHIQTTHGHIPERAAASDLTTPQTSDYQWV